MARFWTTHWQFRYWRGDINTEYTPVRSGSNSYRKRGVTVGDVVYIVSLRAGYLYLGGRMTVKQILTRPEAVRLWSNSNLYDAREWIVDSDEAGTLLHLHRRLAPVLTKRLRFASKSGPKEPCFVSETELDNQATRGVRELTPDSAALLDRIIEVTDRLPRSDHLLTVTRELLENEALPEDPEEFRLPDEIPRETIHVEGSVRRVEVNRYERDPNARAACIATYGTACTICGVSFGASYGAEAEGYIHVHHLRPLATIGSEYVVDPVRDMRPVCPNCHAVLHLGGRCLTIEDVQRLVASVRKG